MSTSLVYTTQTNETPSTYCAAKQILLFAKFLKTHTPAEAIATLLTHNNQANVRLVKNGTRVGFAHKNGTVYNGLTPMMKEAFYQINSLPRGLPNEKRNDDLKRKRDEVDKINKEIDRERGKQLLLQQKIRTREMNAYSGSGLGKEFLIDNNIGITGVNATNQSVALNVTGQGIPMVTGSIQGVRTGDDLNHSGPRTTQKIIYPQEVYGADDIGLTAEELNEVGKHYVLRKMLIKCKREDRTKLCCYKGSGLKHGSQVHKEIEEIVSLIRHESNVLNSDGTYPMTLNDLKDLQDLKAKGHTFAKSRLSYFEKDRLVSILVTIQDMDPCTLLILNTLIEKQLIPIRSEYVVHDERIMIATAFDLIAWDVRNNLSVAIELKTGHNTFDNYDEHDGRSYFVTNNETLCIKDTALNRAVLQTVLGCLFSNRMMGCEPDAAIILRTGSYTQTAASQSCQTDVLLNRSGLRASDQKKKLSAKITTRIVQIYKIPKVFLTFTTQKILYTRLKMFSLQKLKTRRSIKKDQKTAIINECLSETFVPSWKVAPQLYTLWYWLITSKNPKPLSEYLYRSYNTFATQGKESDQPARTTQIDKETVERSNSHVSQPVPNIQPAVFNLNTDPEFFEYSSLCSEASCTELEEFPKSNISTAPNSEVKTWKKILVIPPLPPPKAPLPLKKSTNHSKKDLDNSPSPVIK